MVWILFLNHEKLFELLIDFSPWEYLEYRISPFEEECKRADQLLLLLREKLGKNAFHELVLLLLAGEDTYKIKELMQQVRQNPDVSNPRLPGDGCRFPSFKALKRLCNKAPTENALIDLCNKYRTRVNEAQSLPQNGNLTTIPEASDTSTDTVRICHSLASFEFDDSISPSLRGTSVISRAGSSNDSLPLKFNLPGNTFNAVGTHGASHAITQPSECGAQTALSLLTPCPHKVPAETSWNSKVLIFF